MSKRFLFEAGDIQFTFDPSNPDYLLYKIYGNYKGCKCEGELIYSEVNSLISQLIIVRNSMKEKIKYKGREYSKEEILELYKLLEP